MHVHGAHLNPNATNLYSAVEAEKAAAARQAAEVRKKLLSSASGIEGEAEDQAQAVSMTSEANQEDSSPDSDQQDTSEQHAADKTDSTSEDDSPDPISIWG